MQQLCHVALTDHDVEELRIVALDHTGLFVIRHVRADSHRDARHAVHVRERRAQGLAEDLRYAVEGVGPRGIVLVDLEVHRVAHDRVDAACVDDSTASGDTRCLEQVVRADDVRAEEFVLEVLGLPVGVGRQVDDNVDAVECG